MLAQRAQRQASTSVPDDPRTPAIPDASDGALSSGRRRSAPILLRRPVLAGLVYPDVEIGH